MSPRRVFIRLGKRQCELANTFSVRHVLYFHRFVGNRAGYATRDSKYEGGVMSQSIRDVMTSNPCTIDAQKIRCVRREDDAGGRCRPRADRRGRQAGRDADRPRHRYAGRSEGRNPDQVKSSTLRRRQLVTIDPQQDLDEALRIMAQHQVRRLPWSKKMVELIGVVAQADIAREGDDASRRASW